MKFLIIRCVIFILLQVFSINSMIIKNKFVIKALSTSIVSIGLSFSTIDNVQAANDAIDGAMRAMTSTKEKIVEDREFDELPNAAKKRRAIEYCKDNARIKNVGYKSASECTSSVINGDFSIVTASSIKKPTEVISPSPSSSSSSRTTTSSSRTSSATLKAMTEEKVQKLEKVEDLSDLSAGAKKRRSLAACKKDKTRKFAGFSSESKCTEQVLAGKYEKVIEALEYGK